MKEIYNGTMHTFYTILAMEHNSTIYKNAKKVLEELNNSEEGRVWIKTPDRKIIKIPKNSEIKFIQYSFSK